MTPLNLFLHSFSLEHQRRHRDDFDIFDLIKVAVDYRFQGVSISANAPDYRWLGGHSAERHRSIAAALRHHNLLCHIDTSGTAPNHLATMLRVAKTVGAEQLRTYTRYTDSQAEIIRQTQQDLKQIAPFAESIGVRILLENHETFRGQEIAAILSAVNSPAVGALYDYGNSQMVLEDPLDALDAMAPFVGSAHLKDHMMIRPEHSPEGRLTVLGVPIGMGCLDIVETTKRLLAAGLDRIAFENSWAYAAPVKSWALNKTTRAQLGRGSFQFATPPFAPNNVMLSPANFTPKQLVDFEWEAFKFSIHWLHQTFQAAGIEINT